MNRGVPPTARKARTGEFTPPGVTARARSSSACEAGASKGYAVMGPVSQPHLSAPARGWAVGSGAAEPPGIRLGLGLVRHGFTGHRGVAALVPARRQGGPDRVHRLPQGL